VHDRLGEQIGYFPRNQEELEEMANARVPDEFIFCRDTNTYRVESREIRHMSLHQQWQILMKGLDVFHEKFGRRIFSKLPIMKFHRSKQSVLMKGFNG